MVGPFVWEKVIMGVKKALFWKKWLSALSFPPVANNWAEKVECDENMIRIFHINVFFHMSNWASRFPEDQCSWIYTLRISHRISVSYKAYPEGLTGLFAEVLPEGWWCTQWTDTGKIKEREQKDWCSEVYDRWAYKVNHMQVMLGMK